MHKSADSSGVEVSVCGVNDANPRRGVSAIFLKDNPRLVVLADNPSGESVLVADAFEDYAAAAIAAWPVLASSDVIWFAADPAIQINQISLRSQNPKLIPVSERYAKTNSMIAFVMRLRRIGVSRFELNSVINRISDIHLRFIAQ